MRPCHRQANVGTLVGESVKMIRKHILQAREKTRSVLLQMVDRKSTLGRNDRLGVAGKNLQRKR